MARIDVKDVSLVFPLYLRPTSDPTGEIKTDDPRMIRDQQGQALGVSALRNINFTIESGDRLAIIGRNGSGKTSLLQVLAGILPPDHGQVTVEGKSTNLININLGMQAEATGHRNITLRGLAAGRTHDEIEQRRQSISEFSELGEFLNMPLFTYSAGMRMRLNFAIATAFEPDILILDEWLSAGDADFKKRASQRMTEFVNQAGILILASHSLGMLMKNCNKCLWLEKGKVVEIGMIRPVLNAYRSSLKR